MLEILTPQRIIKLTDSIKFSHFISRTQMKQGARSCQQRFWKIAKQAVKSRTMTFKSLEIIFRSIQTQFRNLTKIFAFKLLTSLDLIFHRPSMCKSNALITSSSANQMAQHGYLRHMTQPQMTQQNRHSD